jgi:isocitrate dehydrogenase (NAD+)
MLDRIGEGESASRVRLAFEEIVREGKTLTRDVGGTASTSEFAAAIMARLRR